MKEYLYIFTFYFFNFLLKLIPNKLLKIFANFIGFIAFKLNKKHRAIILKNLEYFCKLAKHPQSLELTKRVYKKFAYYILSMVKNQNISKENLLKQIKLFKNDEYLKELLDRGEKIVFTTAHYGYWEILPAAVAIKYNCKINIIGRALASPKINAILTKYREKFGVKLIEKTNALRPMIKALNNHELVGIVSDQDAHIKESSEFLLYGKKVTQSNAASMVAKRCEAYLLPVYIYEINDGYCIEFFKPLNAKELSIEELSFYQLECTKKMWEKNPSEYFWFHKRFKTFYEDEY